MKSFPVSTMITLNVLRRRIGEEKWYAVPFAGSADFVQAKMRLARRALDEFAARLGAGDRPVAVYHVPGRVEVLGNHTDYAGGMVLNYASDRGFVIISAGNSSSRFRLAGAEGGHAGLDVDLNTMDTRILSPGDTRWFIYPRSVLTRFVADFGRESFRGVDAAFAGDLPPASGMSSSSTLVVATFLALNARSALDGDELFREMAGEPRELAAYLGCCENGFDYTFKGRVLKGGRGVGLFGGSQDHTAILTAKKSKLSLNRYRPVRHVRDIAPPGNMAVVVAFSGYPSGKARETQAAFNLIARRIADIPRIYNAARGTEFPHAGEMLGLPQEKVCDVLRRHAGDETPALRNRFQHFYEQNNVLIPEAVRALDRRDEASFGGAINASHESCKRCLGNISPEMDALVRCAREQGAVGASGFGAGFGGSAYAVVRREGVQSFTEKWRKSYLARCAPPREAQFFVCELAAGACEMFVDSA